VAKTKGTVILKAVKALRGRKQESLAKLPQALHHYLEDRIIVSSWYPEEDFFQLLCATAALFPGGDAAFEMLGAATAHDHFEGMYNEIVKRDLASRARIMWKTQHDSGEMVLVEQTPTSVTYELREWKPVSAKYCRVVGGYYTELHRLDGAPAPTYSHPACRANGSPACRFVVSWR